MAADGWRLGRGRRQVKERRRRAAHARTSASPSARLADRLDDASFVTAHYDEEWDLPHWDGPVSDRLRRSAWTIRYLGAGQQFRTRVLRTIGLWAAGALVVIAAVLGLSWLAG